MIQYIITADDQDDDQGHGMRKKIIDIEISFIYRNITHERIDHSGTHVSGSVAGNIQQASSASAARDLFEFNGMVCYYFIFGILSLRV